MKSKPEILPILIIIETYAKDGEFGGNLGQAKDKFYKDLKVRQDNYASLSASEQSKIIQENN